MVDRCEPPPELRGMDGWHWLRTETHGPVLCRWAEHRGAQDDWRWHYEGNRDNDISPAAIEVCGWHYIAPVTPPAEVEALRAERDAAIARTAAACANAVEAYDEIRTVRDALKSRVDALERALRDAALQLAYLDERSPSGTTPTIIARILAALEATP